MGLWDRLVQVDEAVLHTALTTRAIETVGERIIKALSRDAAIESRDSLAKNIYARMFDWLVAAVNRKISALGGALPALPLRNRKKRNRRERNTGGKCQKGLQVVASGPFCSRCCLRLAVADLTLQDLLCVPYARSPLCYQTPGVWPEYISF